MELIIVVLLLILVLANDTAREILFGLIILVIWLAMMAVGITIIGLVGFWLWGRLT